MRWQYNGVARWTDVVDWCYANLEPEQYYPRWETITFYNEQAYTLFLLRWS